MQGNFPSWWHRQTVKSWRVTEPLFDKSDKKHSQQARFEGLHGLCRTHAKEYFKTMSTLQIQAIPSRELNDIMLVVSHHKGGYDVHSDKLYNALTRYARKHHLNN